MSYSSTDAKQFVGVSNRSQIKCVPVSQIILEILIRESVTRVQYLNKHSR